MEMANMNEKMKIKIVKDGPYVVTGNVPLSEKIIEPKENEYVFKDGREFPLTEEYYLCRCGKSRNKPFCDGSHEKTGFKGTETASKNKYENRADLLVGPELDLFDDSRCAFARFCHRNEGNVWELTENSGDPHLREEAIIAASDCPAGRLVALDKDGTMIEPQLEPSIHIIQDPEKTVSSGIYVQGNILVESADGQVYEVRNRIMLCRCGKSRNKPFCDASHVPTHFSDKE
ncbi:MAG: CDGSH iron-sulfur domain-containing protein [Anaerolineaceae bacterium]